MPPKKKVAAKRTSKAVDEAVKFYRCTMCGKEETNPEGKFYKLSYSNTHKGNDSYAHVCIACTKEEFERQSKKHNPKVATMIICAMLNVPFYRSLYESINKSRDDFSFGYYIRQINSKQYQGKTFALTLATGELETTKREAEDEAEELAESNWSVDERRAKNEVVGMMGYDPFDGYAPKVRKKLFTELLGYLDDDELLNDNYKLSQIIQVINNNLQINQYDVVLSKLDPAKEAAEISELNKIKKDLVASNEKIAKENGISVKGRGDQRAGKGTLTGLMRDMREKNLDEVAENYFNQLQSPNTRWAIDISMKSMLENIHLDENDVNSIVEHQRSLIDELQTDNDQLKEERRLWKVKEFQVDEQIKKLEEKIIELGGELNG